MPIPKQLKKAASGFCLLAILHMGFTFRANAQQTFLIPKTAQQPVIDGEAEAAWDLVGFSSITNVYGGIITDEQDLSADWKAMWDESNLYLLFLVNDDTLFNLGTGASKFWIHDCAEIFFDLLNDKDEISTDETPDDDNYQYRFIWDLDDEPIYEAPPTEGMVNASRTRTSGADTIGYNIEVMIPWATLAAEFPFGDVEIGKLVGTEVKIADLDAPSVPAGVWGPHAELLWNNPTKENLKTSSAFGTIQLVNATSGDLAPPSAISDLEGTVSGSHLVSLTWNAPSDDNTGRAEIYELSFGTDSIDVSLGMAELKQLTNAPLMAGEKEILAVDSLEAGTVYYFAIRSLDPFANSSALSNIIKIKTFDPDMIAPDPVSDLAINSSSSFMAELTWTATGDDGSTGTATAYELRFYHKIINLENWESATLAQGVPVPLAAGQKQSFRLHGLQPEQTYFFALRVRDETLNSSDISNVPELTTPAFTYKVNHSMDQMIGTNSFIDAPMENMEALGFIREYHPWSFTEIEDDIFEYNRWNGFWDFDKYYSDLKELGITVCPALWGSPGWLESDPLHKPLGDDVDAEDPESYREMSQFVYQFAARYGHTTVEDSKLLVNTGQTKKSGMGVLSYFEDWNEQDRDWAGRDAQFIAEEYAAMASANVDGHAGTMGEGFGIKTADPSAKFVMGGLYILGTEYISDMYNWFVENRADHRWPIDVINMHHYSHTDSKNGICPEEDAYKARVSELIDWRNEYAPENEVWITEFGYDTNDDSPNRINPFADFTQQEIQAQWLVRTYLLLSSIEVDRVAQFMIRDTDNDSEPRWSDCGLTLSDAEGNTPKTSWYYTYTLKNVLEGYYFDRVVSESEVACVYRYVNEAEDSYVYALWSPTGDGSSSQYRLKIPANPIDLRKIELSDGSTTGTRKNLDSSSDMLTLEIGESPVFLLANYGEPDGLAPETISPRLQVFPNPSNKTIQIKLPATSQIASITAYATDGRVVRKLENCQPGQLHSMNLEALEDGIYILVARFGNSVLTEKIIKQ